MFNACDRMLFHEPSCNEETYIQNDIRTYIFTAIQINRRIYESIEGINKMGKNKEL